MIKKIIQIVGVFAYRVGSKQRHRLKSVLTDGFVPLNATANQMKKFLKFRSYKFSPEKLFCLGGSRLVEEERTKPILNGFLNNY